jgi:hypothetical protein
MTIFTTITICERYLDVDEETKDFYTTLGLPYPKIYKYADRSYNIDDIIQIEDIPDCPTECVVVFNDGYAVIAQEDPNDLYIRITDLKNGSTLYE